MKFESLDEIQAHFARFPMERVRLDPPPGTAVKENIPKIKQRHRRLCEMYDYTLIDKTTGLSDYFVSDEINAVLYKFLEKDDLGFALGGSFGFELKPGEVQMPDGAYYSWSQFPNRKLPDEDFPQS